MMQSFQLMNEGVVQIEQIETIQSVPSKAAVAQAAPAAAKALPAPPSAKDKAAPSKAAPSKVITRRPAPAREEADPAAKLQKVKKDLAAKATRFEKEKKKKEDRLEKVQRQNARIQMRYEKIRARITDIIDENVFVQSSLIRSGYIPFTLDESEMCDLEAQVQACKRSMIAVERMKDYSSDEYNFMRRIIHDRTPLFNSVLSEKFNIIMKEMTERPFDQIERRRAEHPDARFIEDFISDELKESWDACHVTFIKAYYFWKVIFGQETCSKFNALNNFMVVFNNKLRRRILIEAETAAPKIIIKVPEWMLFTKTIRTSFV